MKTAMRVAALIGGASVLTVGLGGCGKAPICVDPAVVKEITALHYREATVRLEDGREIVINQATLKPGDSFCAKWKYD